MVFGLDQLIAFMSQYGYFAFFVLAFFETTLLPIPSEVVLPFAGALVAIGVLNPFFILADVITGNLAGNLFGYFVSYFLGIDVVLKYGKKFGFKMDSYTKAEAWIKKYGAMFAFITEILPVVRSATPIVCGAFKMNLKKFIIYTVAGFTIWAGVLMYIGFAVAGNWQTIANLISIYGLYIGAIVVVIGVIMFRNWIYSVLTGLYKGPKKNSRRRR